MARLPLLLSLSCLGTALALLGGRALLARQPALTPATATDRLVWLQHWDADPWRRREASLLLAGRGDKLQEQRQWLRGQGWGPDPLAALVLKQDALAALSTNSAHTVVEGATHPSLLSDEEDAAAVTRAILDVVASVRSGAPLG